MNEKLIKLIKENPSLEVKFNITGDTIEDDNSFYIGDIRSVRVGDYIEYGDRVYDDDEDVKELIADKLDDTINTMVFSVAELNKMINDEYSKLDVKKVIWVYVGV